MNRNLKLVINNVYSDKSYKYFFEKNACRVADFVAKSANDMRFATNQGFNSGDQFFSYLRDTFDCLYTEGTDFPKMMSIGLHCRLVGRPGRFMALQRFIDHVALHDDVWICRRSDIARHWHAVHPA